MNKTVQVIVAAAALFFSAHAKAQSLAGIDARPSTVLEIGTNYTPNALPVYPNPVTSSTRIQLPLPSVATVSVSIIDLNGVVNREYQYAPGTSILDVDMSRLPMGLYSVRVSGKDLGFYNLKVVKE